MSDLIHSAYVDLDKNTITAICDDINEANSNGELTNFFVRNYGFRPDAMSIKLNMDLFDSDLVKNLQSGNNGNKKYPGSITVKMPDLKK